MSGNTRLKWVTTACVLLLLVQVPALAQFRLDIEGVAAEAFPNTEAIATPPEHINQLGGQRMIMVDQNINAWIFQSHGDEARTRKFLDQQLSLAIDGIDSDVDLTTEQREKLELAGDGDVSMFFAEVEKIREEFDDQAMNDGNQLNVVWQRVQPLQQRMRTSLFGSSSVFAKVSDGMLDESQREKLHEIERKRLRFHFVAHLKNTISQAQRTRPFRADQRQAIMDLMQDVAMPSRGTRQMTQNYALYSLWQKRSELASILNKEQMKAIGQLLRRGERMAEPLREEGYIQ